MIFVTLAFLTNSLSLSLCQNFVLCLLIAEKQTIYVILNVSEESLSCHSERSEESLSCHSERSEESQKDSSNLQLDPSYSLRVTAFCVILSVAKNPVKLSIRFFVTFVPQNDRLALVRGDF